MDYRFHDISADVRTLNLTVFHEEIGGRVDWWRYYFALDELGDWIERRRWMADTTAWCRDNLGRRKRAWDTQNGVICIRSPRQATAFKVRWC